jgi:glucose/arabinose dehydrogenase
LAALSSTEPSKPKGIKDWVMQQIQKRVGALAKSPDQIVLLRDADGDGRAETRQVLIGQGLKQPFGMTLSGGYLYVGNTDSLVRVPYKAGDTTVRARVEKVVDLPHGDGHWTRNVLAKPDGQLFLGVGSASNIADGGMTPEQNRANILEVDPARKTYRVYASGIRNPNGMAYEPSSGRLFTVVNERDMLGDDLAPDYLTSVRDGAFYGWPYSYWGQNIDIRVHPQDPALVAKAIKPDYSLSSHVATLGVTFSQGQTLAPAFANGAFVGEHGSWDRSPLNGYQVVFIPFVNGMPLGKPMSVVSGFLAPDHASVYGRPVGVALDRTGALLVADDTGNVVWRVSRAAARPTG